MRTVLHFLLWPLRVAARMTPDGLLFVALTALCAMLSIGANSWSNIPLLIALVLLALWFLAFWQGSRAVKAITFRRRHPEHVFASDPLTVTMQLTNTSKLPAAGLFVEEDLTQEIAPAPIGRSAQPVELASRPAHENRATPSRSAIVSAQGRTFVMALSGKESSRASYTISLRRRGVYHFTASRIETVYPLGFFRSVSPRVAPGRLVVYPRLGEVNTALFEDVEHTLEAMRRAKPSRAEEEFRGLREYRKEDNPRWIHWRGSARAGELLVREFEEPVSKRVLLLLDTNLRGLGARRFARFENAISFTATVVREFARRGIEVETVALQPNAMLSRVTVSRARRNLDALLEMVSVLRRDDTRTLDALIDAIPRRSLHGAFVLVVGLGSLRTGTQLRWLRAGDNAVRILDARGEEFARIFRRDPGAPETAADEDLLMSLGEDELESEEA
ncbi:MAG TPA: DUF58 domain-containing protein [Planctomycetota bacterium]|nr:DUF58 domain-containing protein [Planctomycetota bacterium]